MKHCVRCSPITPHLCNRAVTTSLLRLDTRPKVFQSQRQKNPRAFQQAYGDDIQEPAIYSLGADLTLGAVTQRNPSPNSAFSGASWSRRVAVSTCTPAPRKPFSRKPAADVSGAPPTARRP